VLEPTPTPPLRLPAAERRRQLLTTAIEAFSAHGFHDTSMNDVAALAGITKPVLYQHFDSKRHLYLEVLESLSGALADAIAKAAASADTPREQVTAGFHTYFAFIKAQPEAFELLFGSGTRRDPDFAAVIDSVEDTLAGVIAPLIEIELIDVQSRHLLAHGIVGMAEASARASARLTPHIEPGELADRMARLAWAGLRGIEQ